MVDEDWQYVTDDTIGHLGLAIGLGMVSCATLELGAKASEDFLKLSAVNIGFLLHTI